MQSASSAVSDKDPTQLDRPEDFDRPSVAADVVVFSMSFPEKESYRQESSGRLEVLLVKRDGEPFEGLWALPGGFLQRGETLEACVSRKLLVKTGVTPRLLIPAGVYSSPERDPRGWIISRAFMSIQPERDKKPLTGGACRFLLESSHQADGSECITLTHGETILTLHMKALRNAWGQTEWQTLSADGIAFDHAQILMTALADLRWGAGVFRYLFDFLPEEFALNLLQSTQEAITGKPVGAANFRRKSAAYVEETGMMTSGAGHRPAMLYRQKNEMEAEV